MTQPDPIPPQVDDLLGTPKERLQLAADALALAAEALAGDVPSELTEYVDEAARNVRIAKHRGAQP